MREFLETIRLERWAKRLEWPPRLRSGGGLRIPPKGNGAKRNREEGGRQERFREPCKYRNRSVCLESDRCAASPTSPQSQVGSGVRKALGVLALLLTNITALASAQPTQEQEALIAIARSAVRSEILANAYKAPNTKTPPQPVFVTIEIDGKVVGCRGSLIARSASLESEVALEARAAAEHDPRYRPLRPADAERFLVTVTIVSRTEPIGSVDGLKPEDGLVLESGDRKGIVLPWEGKDPKVRLGWAYRKAGVAEGSPVSLYRLVAERFRG